MGKAKSIVSWAFLAAGLLLGSLDARAASYYVAVTGSDANPGTSASPFRSIQKGVNAAAAGDTIVVRDGTYGSAYAVNINKAGTSSAWITLRAERKGGVFLDCQMSCHSFITLGGSAAYWVIRDLDVSNGYWGGFWLNSNGTRNILIQGNRIHHIGNRSDSSSTGITGIYSGAGTTGVVIDGNIIHDVGRTNFHTNGFDHCIYTHGASMVITNNVLYRANGHLIQTASSFSGTIANNTFFGPSLFPNKVSQVMLWDANSNVLIRNNIFYNPRSVGVTSYTSSMSGYCTIDNNIVYNDAGSVGMISPVPAGCTQANNLVNVNPQLVAPALPGFDFHLRSGSPAINAGAAFTVVTTDFDGTARPQGAGWDIGAFEYSGTTPLPSADTTPPVISGIASSGMSQTGATIAWVTNEAADTQVEYGPTAAYGASTVLNPALSLSHASTLGGLTAGTLYHYRAKSKDASGNLAVSADATFTTALPAAVPGCVNSAGAWANTAVASQSGSFTAEFDAVPGSAGMDAVIGLSNGAATDYPSLAAIVRFNNAGTIDARNGGAYAAAAPISYVAGLSYRFRLVVSLSARTYSAYVKQGANAEQLIGSNYAFRPEQAAVAVLNNVGLFASTGSAGVCGASATAAAAPADTTPPVISAVAVSAPSQTGASIGWTTNEPADTQVEYGPTAAYGASTVLNSALSLSHASVLGGLTAGTLYHYRVKSKDAMGNLAMSADATFTTAGAALPAGCVNSAGAWRNVSLPAQTGVFTAEFDAVPGTANIDGVGGLSNGAAADYPVLAAAVRFNNAGRIDARNGGGYAAAASIPYVSGLTYHFRLVVNVSARTYSAYVRQGANAEQLIGGNYAFRTEQATATALNNLGLFASTGSEQVCAAAVTASGAPADTAAPVISGVSASAVSQTGAMIGWATNEPADTQVDYGPTTAYGASTVLNSALSTGHAAALSGLTAGTLYHYRAKSKDAAGNLATSPDAVFTTAAPTPLPTACISSAGRWANAAFATQAGTFTAEFDAVPGSANMDGVSGLSNGPASSYNSLAAAVRFSNAGTIDARNGGSYAAASRIPYAAGLTYHFRLVVDVRRDTYSAYVKQGANPETMIGANYAFRVEQRGVPALNNLGLFASKGSEAVCGAVVK